MHRLRQTLALVIGLSLLWPVAVSAVPPTQAVCAGNLLRNPSFEEGFSDRGRGEVSVANGWTPWWYNVPGKDGYNYVPEYKPEDASRFGTRRIHSGNFAQKFFNTFATHTAGFYQRVAVTPGRRLNFSIWVQVWSSEQNDPDRSEKPGAYQTFVGIDPSGGTDALGPGVVWSPVMLRYDEWVQISVEAVAQANNITVFTKGQPLYRTKHNDSYWDDACLVASTTVALSPTITNTPPPPTPAAPTRTPTLTPKPTATPVPSATFRASATPPPTLSPTSRPTAIVAQLPATAPPASPTAPAASRTPPPTATLTLAAAVGSAVDLTGIAAIALIAVAVALIALALPRTLRPRSK